MDDTRCYDTVCELHWLEGRQCAFCDTRRVSSRGCDEKEPAWNCCKCKDCGKRLNDLTGIIIAGNHQPFKAWILCHYFMGLNLSNEKIAQESDLNRGDVQQITTELRGYELSTELETFPCTAKAFGLLRPWNF